MKFFLTFLLLFSGSAFGQGNTAEGITWNPITKLFNVFFKGNSSLNFPDSLPWAPDTATFSNTAMGTVANAQFYSRRIGDTYDFRGTMTTGTTTANTCVLIFKAGTTINLNKIGTGSVPVGFWYRYNSTNVFSAGNDGVFFSDGVNTNEIFLSFAKNTTGFTKPNCSTIFGSAENIAINFSVPIN